MVELLKNKHIESKDEFVNEAVVEALNSARYSVANEIISPRDFASFGIPSATKVLSAVKIKIREFHDETATLMAVQNSAETYKLATNLFPKTKAI